MCLITFLHGPNASIFTATELLSAILKQLQCWTFAKFGSFLGLVQLGESSRAHIISGGAESWNEPNQKQFTDCYSPVLSTLFFIFKESYYDSSDEILSVEVFNILPTTILWSQLTLRAFRIMDDDSNKKLDMNEFKKGISDYGLVLEDGVSASYFNF